MQELHRTPVSAGWLSRSVRKASAGSFSQPLASDAAGLSSFPANYADSWHIKELMVSAFGSSE